MKTIITKKNLLLIPFINLLVTNWSLFLMTRGDRTEWYTYVSVAAMIIIYGIVTIKVINDNADLYKSIELNWSIVVTAIYCTIVGVIIVWLGALNCEIFNLAIAWCIMIVLHVGHHLACTTD